MLYFVLGFAVLAVVCYLGAKHQEESVKLIESDPNLQFRVQKTRQTVKFLQAYAIGSGVVAAMIFLMWLY